MNRAGYFGCFLFAALLLGFGPQSRAADVPKESAAGIEYFEKHVRPLLVEQCYKCHSDVHKKKAGLLMTTRAGLLTGGDSGPALVPGKAAQSLLIKAVKHLDPDLKMPPKKKKLSDQQINILSRWVAMGAPMPKKVDGGQAANASKDHWAWRPIGNPKPPAARLWGKSPADSQIDRWIKDQLEPAGLKPSAPADRYTLIRRFSFDLTGLPPTYQEVQAFITDKSPKAYSKAIDRLLASKAYGQRWGRYWLDVARYADTKGYVFTEEARYPYAYTYRDYVVRAFNEDLPFDRFIMEQLAADQLDLGDDKRALAAMGFLTVGKRFRNNKLDIIDDRIDVLSRGFLGLTATCARCHAHKFDPISMDDYYGLGGIFASSTEPKELPLVAQPDPKSPGYQKFKKELDKRQKVVDDYKKKLGDKKQTRAERDQLRKYVRKVEQWKVDSPTAPPRAMVMHDLPKPIEPRILVRGSPGRPGKQVTRQFFRFIVGEKPKSFDIGSGRLQLAAAIAAGDNPLTARVIVNRVWQHHFGFGLVRTTSNFGTRGERPTHPQLLDYLARWFIDQGWSIKKLHRLIMHSNVYQQASKYRSDGMAKDPENRLLWRFNRQRLDFEATRDALLAATRGIDGKVGGRPVDILKAPYNNRRTIYGFVDRNNMPDLLATFDFPNPDASTGQRPQTTVPQQALFMMNSDFMVDCAKHLMNTQAIKNAKTPEARVQAMYRRVFGRSPYPAELRVGIAYTDGESAKGKTGKLPIWTRYGQALLCSNAFMFVD
jgi:hypothetical protein